MPELRVLGSFAAVVEEGSISAGARRMGVTQPAMSRQIQALERELGVRLLVRGAGGLQLTAAGARFYERVTHLLTQIENVIGRTKQEAEQSRATLHVIAPSATIDYAVVPFIRSTASSSEKGYDVPILDCEAADPFRVFDVAVARGADMGISTRMPRPEWKRLSAGIALLYAHVPRGHELADRASIAVEELVAHRLVLLTPSSAARRVFDEEVLRHDGAYGEHVVVRHPSVAEALVQNGQGIAVLTDDPRAGVVGIPIVGEDGLLSAPLIAGWDPRNPQAEMIQNTAELMRAFLAKDLRRRMKGLPNEVAAVG